MLAEPFTPAPKEFLEKLTGKYNSPNSFTQIPTDALFYRFRYATT